MSDFWLGFLCSTALWYVVWNTWLLCTQARLKREIARNEIELRRYAREAHRTRYGGHRARGPTPEHKIPPEGGTVARTPRAEV